MIETAPVGFATPCEPLGRFVFKTIHQQLRYHRIDDDAGGVTNIDAQSRDVAGAV